MEGLKMDSTGEVSRRQFITSFAAAAIAAGTASVAASVAAIAGKNTPTVSLPTRNIPIASSEAALFPPLTQATFESVLRSPFRVETATGQSLNLKLIEVEKYESGTNLEQFVLIFQGSGDSVLTQNTYSIEHRKLGKFDLFMAPLTQTGRSHYYQAAFNRLI